MPSVDRPSTPCKSIRGRLHTLAFRHHRPSSSTLGTRAWSSSAPVGSSNRSFSHIIRIPTSIMTSMGPRDVEERGSVKGGRMHHRGRGRHTALGIVRDISVEADMESLQPHKELQAAVHPRAKRERNCNKTCTRVDSRRHEHARRRLTRFPRHTHVRLTSITDT